MSLTGKDTSVRIIQGTTTTVGGLSFNRGTGPSDYVEILVTGNLRKEGWVMSDYELLSLVLMILGIIVSLLIAYINQSKK